MGTAVNCRKSNISCTEAIQIYLCKFDFLQQYTLLETKKNLLQADWFSRGSEVNDLRGQC